MAGEPNQVLWRGVQPVSGIRGVWPAIDSERARGVEQALGASIATLYTVPAGKKLFIASSQLSSRESVAAASACFLDVANDSAVFQYYLDYHMYDIAGQLVTFRSYSPAEEALAGWVVRVYSDHANIDATGIFNGWLEGA